MKKSIILLVAACCTLCAYGQATQKIAVYVSGNSDLSIKKVFGSKLAEAITRNGEFKAVDYTADFDAEIKKQQGFNHAVTAEDIFQLEERFGAQFLCIATMITMAKGSGVTASLYNSTNDELGVAAGGDIGSIADMDKTAKAMAIQIADFAAGREIEQPKKGRAARAAEKLTRKEQREKQDKKQAEQEEPIPAGPIDDAQLFNMIYVQGGAFMMGCPDAPDACEKDAVPAHRVTLSDFYIGATEVTHAQWKAVTGSYPERGFKGDDQLPVCVSWLDVQDFIGKLNSKTGAKYRLPTEAEWEYAARGGELSQGYKYSGSSDVDEAAWYADNSGRKAHIVGGKQANELGIYDMSGNVWEWCRDRYDKYSDTEQNDPVVTDSGKNRVMRGGSWDAKREDTRVWRRSSANPEVRPRNIGFRLVRNAK
jgi:formylglycine-generating enzyme required for sulfatase activity